MHAASYYNVGTGKGSDPILHPDFWPLLELLAIKKIPFTLMGNPFHLTDEICRRMKLLGCEKYQLSIDGLEQTHDWFRRPGSYRATLDGIATINRAGIRSVVMTTVSGTNIREVPGIIDAVVKAGVNVYAFARYCPTAADASDGIAGTRDGASARPLAGPASEKITGMTPREYRRLLEVCDAKFKAWEAAGCQTYFNRKDHLWTLYRYETGAFRIPESARPGMIYGGCNCGNCHMTLLPTGDVYACRRVQNSRVGNVFEDRLADLWVAEMEQYRQYDRFKKCSRCELLPWCRGCPAVASGARGDFYDADPQCWKTRNDITGEVL